MAQRYYGLDRGQVKKDVTEGSSSTGTLDVEVRIDLAGIGAGNLGRNEALIMLENIMDYILEDQWPPA